MLGLYLKIPVKKKLEDGTEKDAELPVLFEASSGAIIFCKGVSKELEVVANSRESEGQYTRKSYTTRKKDTSSGVVKFDKTTKDVVIDFKRSDAVRARSGKIITFRTGIYSKKFAANELYVPKTFSFRYPAWLNNAFALDFAAEHFGAFSGTAQAVANNPSRIYQTVYLGKRGFLIPAKGRILSEPLSAAQVASSLEKYYATLYPGYNPASTKDRAP